jgi:hypothetical protein
MEKNSTHIQLKLRTYLANKNSQAYFTKAHMTLVSVSEGQAHSAHTKSTISLLLLLHNKKRFILTLGGVHYKIYFTAVIVAVL